jgi:tetratricopeptide (TPR) repeat protein
VRYFLPQNILPIITEPAFGIPNSLRANLDVNIINHRHYPPYRVITNQNRIRHQKNFRYSKTPGVYRILCLGDSILFGPGVNNDEVFSFYLEKLLNGHRTKSYYEVINVSSPGWGPLEYFKFLKNEGYKYSPDLVIFSIISDDIRQNFVDHISWEHLKSFNKTISLKTPKVVLDSNWSIPQILMKFRQLPLFEEITRHSHVFSLIRKRLNMIYRHSRLLLIENSKRLDNFLGSIDFQGYDSVTWIFERFKLELPRYKDNTIEFFSKFNNEKPLKVEANTVLFHFLINQLVNTIQDMGAEPLIIRPPYYTETLKMHESKQNNILKNKTPPVFQLFFSEPFTQSQMSFKVPLFFPHDNHLTPAGHRLIASLLYNFLIKNIPIINSQHTTKPQNYLDPKMEEQLRKANNRITEKLESDIFWKFVQGLRYRNINQLDKAKETLLNYLDMRPKDSEAHYQLGMIYWSENSFAKALEHFKISKKGYPTEQAKYDYTYQHTQLFSKAWNFRNNNQDDNALAILQEAIELEGPFLGAVYNLSGSIHSKKGNLAKAEQFFKKAIEFKPKFSQYYRSLGNLYFDNQLYQDAINVYEKSLDLNPRELKIYILMSISNRKVGNIEEGLKWFQEFLKHGGNYNLLREWKMIPASTKENKSKR